MTALFADTFFWIALADFTDSAHRRALAFAIEQRAYIVTIDEVLTEYLTFFAKAHEPDIDLTSPAFVSFHGAGIRFARVCNFTGTSPISGTA